MCIARQTVVLGKVDVLDSGGIRTLNIQMSKKFRCDMFQVVWKDDSERGMNEERRRNPAHENLNQAIFRSGGVIIMRMGVREGEGGEVLLEKLAQAAIWVTTRPPFCQIPHSTLQAAMYDTKNKYWNNKYWKTNYLII